MCMKHSAITNDFLTPPRHINLLLRMLIALAERIAGRTLMPPRLLAWYPRALISSGILESLITRQDGAVTRRILKLVRLQVSLAVSCPFCIAMNSDEAGRYSISAAELRSLQRGKPEAPTFSEHERAALRYAVALSRTPIRRSVSLERSLRRYFSEREIVVLASTIAQVNYWARLLQGMGITG